MMQLLERVAIRYKTIIIKLCRRNSFHRLFSLQFSLFFQMLTKYQEEILTVESFAEFCDVNGNLKQ